MKGLEIRLGMLSISFGFWCDVHRRWPKGHRETAPTTRRRSMAPQLHPQLTNREFIRQLECMVFLGQGEFFFP